MSIESIRARVEAATPGPWTGNGEAPLDHEGCRVWPWDKRGDMDFAYHARTDIPALLDAVAAAVAVRNAWMSDATNVPIPWQRLFDALDRLEATP